MRLALFQPDIPHNVGAAIRCAACFGARVDIIEPCGFPLDAPQLRRTAMDYRLLAEPMRHRGWEAFKSNLAGGAGRLVLLTTAGDTDLWDFAFAAGDVLLTGRESEGVPPEVRAAADARVRIPIAPEARSLNVAVAAAIALAEARRQLGWEARAERPVEPADALSKDMQ